MIKRKNISLFLLLGALFAGCSLDDTGPQVTVGQFTLQVQNELSLNTLSWNPVKVTGFKEYIILQAPFEIPSSPEPVVGGDVRILKRIDDADITSLQSSDILFTQRACYKIYAAVDDRFIQSANVCVNQDLTIIDGFNDRGHHVQGLDEMILFDRLNGRFTPFNYKTGAVLDPVSDFTFFFPIVQLSKEADVTNVFVYEQSPPILQKYTFPGMSPQSFKDFFGVLWAVNFYDQFVFVAVEESGKTFQVLRRSNLSIVDSEPGMFGNRAIAVFPGAPLIVIEVGEDGLNRYSIDANGKIILLESKSTGISQPSIQSASANSNQYFITGRMGSILTRDGNIAGHLNTDPNATVLITRISEDEKKVVYLTSENAGQQLVIADISSIPAISELTSFTLPSASYSDVILADGIIYVVGATFTTNNGETFLLKFPMPS